MATETDSELKQAFHERIHSNNMYGLWELASQMTAHPKPQSIPYQWKWSLFESILEDAGEAVPIGDERRALQLFNPGLAGRWATTNNLLAAIQMLLPGEVARAHRHVPTAIRFIMEGNGAYTAVDGERVIMKPGDLVLTPSWAWHDHGNETDERVVWFDGLDMPLVLNMDAMFFELYDAFQVPLRKANNASQSLHGHASLNPTWVKKAENESSPLLIYGWEETLAALKSMRDEKGSEYDGIAIEYTHPQTGGPVLPTMACWAQLLRPRERTKAHRTTGSAVYLAVEGKGETIIEGKRFVWEKGDVVVLPSWAAHEHANTSQTEDAILFSIQDYPVLQKLGLYREEPLEDEHQQVTSTFNPN